MSLLRGFSWSLVVLACLTASTQVHAQEPPASLPSFQGKFLVVYKKSDPEFSVNLEKARLETLGDTQFLVGIGIDTGVLDNWQIGRTIWVALDDISEINIFDSLDELQESLSEISLKVVRRARRAAPPDATRTSARPSRGSVGDR